VDVAKAPGPAEAARASAAVPRLGIGVLYNPALPEYLRARRETYDYVEVIPEMFWTDRGPGARPRFVELEAWVAMLVWIAAQCPVVGHNIGLSLGSADWFDDEYPAHIEDWNRRYRFAWHSDHLSFVRITTAEGHDHNAGLAVPVPYDHEVLDIVVERIERVRRAVAAPFLLENSVAFIDVPDQDLTEPEFLNAVAARSGCGLLLDVHNVYVNARNHGFEALDFIAALNLEVPAWLVERASDDDPPTVIGDDLVERFERAGVERFVVVVGPDVMEDQYAEFAEAIGVLVPGITAAESLEDEAAPVAGALDRLLTFLERFDNLRRLKLASIDMRLAETAARALLNGEVPAHLERVMETGLVVTYARPYLDSNRAGGVGGRWQPKSGPDREFHRYMIDVLRDSYHAHADRTYHRTITDTAALVGLEGPPIYAEAWWRLTPSQVETLADLAGRQAERFEAAADDAGGQVEEEQ
jgi:uncharacterized protein (UPF0276 family)